MRLLALILCLCLLPGTTLAAVDKYPSFGSPGIVNPLPSPAWPSMDYVVYPLSVKNISDDKRIQSWCGPTAKYHGSGAYRDYKIIRAEALFMEDTFLLVDMSYSTVGRRCVYFSRAAFTNVSHVPSLSLNGTAATTTAGVTPTFGPGTNYDSFDEARISQGTHLSVFFEMNGYLFAEFACSLGTVRAWIPTDLVSAQ